MNKAKIEELETLFQSMVDDDEIDCDLILSMIADLKKSEWIPVSERLPDHHQIVTVASNPAVGRKVHPNILFDSDGNRWLMGDYRQCEVFCVTHWQPLPSIEDK